MVVTSHGNGAIDLTLKLLNSIGTKIKVHNKYFNLSSGTFLNDHPRVLFEHDVGGAQIYNLPHIKQQHYLFIIIDVPWYNLSFGRHY